MSEEIKNDDETEHERREAAQGAKILKTPVQPTPKEIAEHEATHLPYRPWCKYCVQGKAMNRKHNASKRLQTEKDGVPQIVMDYMFMSNKDKDKVSPILVIKDMKSKSIFAHAVSRKGTSDGWIVKKIIDDINGLGYGWTRIVIRSDQEPALLQVKSDIRTRNLNQ